MKLKGGQWTFAVRKDCPQMLHGLQQRIGVHARWRWLFPAELCPHQIQTPLQAAPQPIDGFQGKRQPQFFRSGFDGKSRQHFRQPPPHQRSRQRMTRQDLGQDNGKCFPATTTLPAIGTKHPLTANGLAAGLSRIVAAKKAVPVQGFNFPAAGAVLLFEQKSCGFNASLSRTK